VAEVAQNCNQAVQIGNRGWAVMLQS